jgi:hypothetical protein
MPMHMANLAILPHRDIPGMELSVLKSVFSLPAARRKLSMEILNLCLSKECSGRSCNRAHLRENIKLKYVTIAENGSPLQLRAKTFSTAQSVKEYLTDPLQSDYLIRIMYGNNIYGRR